jgi:hypothetical protein
MGTGSDDIVWSVPLGFTPCLCRSAQSKTFESSVSNAPDICFRLEFLPFLSCSPIATAYQLLLELDSQSTRVLDDRTDELR